MTRDEFLKYCHTELTLRAGVEDDLGRIVELMQRTNQLNSSGTVYSAETIAQWMNDSGWRVYVAELKDRFVDYGRVGVGIARCGRRSWELRTFLLSCRVLTRGITGYFLAWLVGQAEAAGTQSIRCHYRPSGRNHRLETLYKLAGFFPKSRSRDGTKVYEKTPVPPPPPPKWLAVHTESEA
jgi:FkbH-like protein